MQKAKQGRSSFVHQLKSSLITFDTFHILVIFLLTGVPTICNAWIDGTPYFFDHFPNTISFPSAPAQPNAPQLAVGDRRSFFSINFKTHEQYTLQTTLREIGKFCYIFVEDSQWRRTVHPTTVEAIRRAFDDSVPADASRGIYQIQTTLFGPPPDTDGDEKIYLLLLDIRDGATVGSGFIAGFFSPIDQQRGVLRHPELGVPIRSNERDMLYIDTHPLNVGSEEGLGVVAHEFQHLIHWRHDRDEEVWVNEGCSDYAMFLCGYPPQGHVAQFEKRPHVSLTRWPEGSRSQLAHYGASYLWMLYLDEHYGGPGTVAAIVRNHGNGIVGINNALNSRGATKTFPAVFADWKIANFLDDTEFANGLFGYRNQELNLRPRRIHRSYPTAVDGNVLDVYATHYITFSANGGDSGLSLTFVGDSRQSYDVKVIAFQGGAPIAVNNMPLTDTGRGHLIISNFGSKVEEVIFVPSVQAKDNILFPGGSASSYDYNAKLGDKVEFRTWVLPNPVHPRYQDIIAIPSDGIGATPPLITVTIGNTVVTSGQPMTSVQDGVIYTHSFYLSPEFSPEDVKWQISFFDEVVGEGRLGNEGIGK